MTKPLVGTIFAILLISAPMVGKQAKVKHHNVQGVRDEYIVVLPEDVPQTEVANVAADLARDYKLRVKAVYAWSLRGFLVEAKESRISAAAADDRVLYVEQDSEGQMEREALEGETLSSTQWTTWNNVYQWHLDRVDELTWPMRDSQHNMCTEGRTTVAYIIDTGVWRDHSEFQEPVPSRIIRALNFQGTANGLDETATGSPCARVEATYHGTAVASVLAGTHVGAAKTDVVSLRPFDCNNNSRTSDLIEALDWIASPANPYRNRPGVINHSGFVPVMDSLDEVYGDTVVRTVNTTNFPFFTSADNYSTDACQFSPNNRAYTRYNTAGRAFVVGGTSVGTSSTDPNDYRWQEWETVNGTVVPRIGVGSGSNGGACVSIYAPATAIYVAYHDAATNYRTLSGTSFSAPLVAGVAARYIERQRNSTGTTPTAVEVYNWLLAQSTTVVQMTTTAPTYWVCERLLSTGRYSTTAYRTQPNSCPSGYTLRTFTSATNTSDARHVYWDEGYCP